MLLLERREICNEVKVDMYKKNDQDAYLERLEIYVWI